MNNRYILTFLFAFFGAFSVPFQLFSQDNNQPASIPIDSTDAFALSDSSALFDISLEDLINLQVTTASKTAERAVEAPAVLTVITKQDIINYGALTLSEVLERVTGVMTLSTYSGTNNLLSFRGDIAGEFNNHILILIDGRPTRESLFNGNNTSIYNGYPIETIERIEVIRGPGSVLYGTTAMTAVINIITKSGGQNLTSNVGYGSFGTLRAGANAGYGKKDWEIQAGGQIRLTEGWMFNATDEEKNGSFTRDSIPKGESTAGVQLKARYKTLKLNAFWTYATQDAMGNRAQWFNPPDFRQTSHRIFADLGYERQITKFWKSSLNFTFNALDFKSERFRVGNDLLNDADAADFLGEWTNYFELRKNLNLVVGGVFNYQTGSYFIHSIDATTLTPFDITLGKNPNPYPAVPEYELSQTSLYAQADFKPIKQVKIIAGVQANKVPDLSFDFVPRLGLILNPLKPLFVKALFGSAFRAANAFERRFFSPILIGRNDLLPEKVNTFEFQVAYAKTVWSISATYFYTIQSNLIRPSSPGDFRRGGLYSPTGEIVPRYYNAANVTFNGLELELNANLSSWIKGLSTVFNATYQMNKETEFGSNFTLMPNYTAKLGIAYKSAFGLRVGWFTQYFGSFHEPNRKASDGRELTSRVNPTLKDFVYGTLNVGFDISTIIFPESVYREAIGLDVFITNLYNQQIYFPEFIRGSINTIEGRSPFGIFGRLSLKI